MTNDFPPRAGGAQQYVWNLVRHLPAERVAVLAPNWPGWRKHDQAQAFSVERWPATSLWPTPDLRRRLRSMVREMDCDVVLFGHGFPLPLLGPGLAAHGVPYVALTHGVEFWLARTPGFRQALRRSLAGARHVTAVSEYTALIVRRAVPSHVALSVLHPAVDPERFSTQGDGAAVIRRHGLDGNRVILCVSRLVPRKGQDVLIAAMPLVRRLVPDAALVLVGAGPYRSRLEAMAQEAAPGSVVFTGEVAGEDLPEYYAAGEVFAMPCRSRLGGLEVEGFGIAFLEAAAAGKAAVAGRSGGTAEAVQDEVTGVLVEGKEPKAVALALTRLLLDSALSRRLGEAGLRRVQADFTWRARAAELVEILSAAAG